jgi:hypothetical protein
MFVLFAALYFSGCSQHDDFMSLGGPGMNNMNYNSAQFTVLDYTDFNNGINDATLDSDMAFDNSLLNYTFLNMVDDFTPGAPFMKGIPWLEEFNYSRHYGGLLRSLNLTEAQNKSIAGFVTTYHDSIKSLAKQFYNANKNIVAAADTQRRLIADSVKSGKLTREQAFLKIKTLNQNTRTQIQNNPASLVIKADICQTRKTLFDNIASILTPDQLTIWNNAIAKIPSSC